MKKHSFSLLALFILGSSAVSAEACQGLDGQFIFSAETTVQVKNVNLSSGGFSAELVSPGRAPQRVEGTCARDGRSFRFTTASGQAFQGTAASACGETVFSGNATGSGGSSGWYSSPALKRHATPRCQNLLANVPDGRPTPEDCAPSLKTAADVQRAQCLLQRQVWGPGGLPTALRPNRKESNVQDPPYKSWGNPIRSKASIDRWTVNMEYGFFSTFYLYKARRPSGKLAIFQQGHRKEIDNSNGGATIEFFLRNGYDVLAYYMPMIGPNSGPLGNKEGGIHGEIYTYLKTANRTGAYFSPLRYFFDPIIAGINEATSTNRYSQIVITGVSGGGWTTDWIAALDPRINVAVSVAGSLPLSIRNERDMGDQEQFDADTYTYANYNDLYFVGSWGKRHMQISNRNDKIFAVSTTPAYVPLIQEALDLNGLYDFQIDTRHDGHQISNWALANLYPRILGLAPPTRR